MKETGIVRRIDELGRVVIPKEIRKTLRIFEGDPLEFFTESERLVLKKYSPVGAIIQLAKDAAASLNSKIGFSAAVCDTDRILAAKGQPLKELEKSVLTKEVGKLLQSRKTLVSNEDESKIKIAEGDEEEYSRQIIMPIISRGDLYGGIILVSNEEKITETVLSVASFLSDFIARQV